MYYVTLKAKRKNAKRHIKDKCKTIEEAEKILKEGHPLYKLAIYDGNWNFIKGEI